MECLRRLLHSLSQIHFRGLLFNEWAHTLLVRGLCFKSVLCAAKLYAHSQQLFLSRARWSSQDAFCLPRWAITTTHYCFTHTYILSGASNRNTERGKIIYILWMELSLRKILIFLLHRAWVSPTQIKNVLRKVCNLLPKAVADAIVAGTKAHTHTMCMWYAEANWNS